MMHKECYENLHPVMCWFCVRRRATLWRLKEEPDLKDESSSESEGESLKKGRKNEGSSCSASSSSSSTPYVYAKNKIICFF